MAPCGPLYSLQRVYRRQDLDWLRAFGIGEPLGYPPYMASNIKSELLHISKPPIYAVRTVDLAIDYDNMRILLFLCALFDYARGS